MNEYFCTSPAQPRPQGAFSWPLTSKAREKRPGDEVVFCPRPYNVSNGPRSSFIQNSYNTSPMLSFLPLIKTFSECWSTLIVMIYDIFASQTEHIFAIYARTKEHFMSLLGTFWLSITAKYEKRKSG